MVPGGPEEVEPDDLLSERHVGQFMSLNLLRYFTSRDEHLPRSYVQKCEKFLDSIGPPQYYGGSNTGGRIFKVKKPQAPSFKRPETDTIKR